MAQISIVPTSELEKTMRIDSQFYQPEYLESYDDLLKVHHTILNSLADVGDGNHLTIADRFQDHPGIRYIRGQDVSIQMMIEERNEIFIPEDVYEQIKRSHVNKNDVLITIVGANTGLIALAYNIPDKLSASCKLGIIRPHAINPGYLYAFFISKYGQHQILRNKRGGGQTGLILPDLRNIRIARFSNIEKIIANTVFQGHELIKKSNEAYEKAEHYLLSELGLQDWHPPHTLSYIQNYSQIQQRMDAEHLQPKFVELFQILSQHARLEFLGSIITYIKGIEVGGSAYTDSGIPFWRVSNITRHGLDDGNANFITPELYRSLQDNYEPQQGEMLLSKDATPGLAFYLESKIKGIMSSGILRLKINDDIPPYYLEIILNSSVVQMQIEQTIGGSVIQHWKPSDINKTIIPRLSPQSEKIIASLVQKSHKARRDAKALLDKAKRAVEIAIEENEDAALTFLSKAEK